MLNWKFIPRKFLKPWHKVYDELCAPAAVVLGDTLLLIGSTYAKNFPLWMSTNPQADNWKEAVDSFKVGAWDPAFFVDDDHKLYIYFGSSNFYPLYGQEIDRKTFEPMGERIEMFHLQDSIHGWERFGEHNDNTFLKPFMEGAWMNKNNGKYFLQYGAPGTEFSGYGDGVYTSDKPLGPFTYQQHNPFAYKPGGFARGAGHGATYQDLHGNLWHISTIAIGVKNNFERRLGIWPAGFDEKNTLFCNTAYGDYPHYLPAQKTAYNKSQFTGWMLLNYNKPVKVSSTLGGYTPNFAVDEDIKTYWSAKTNSNKEWIETDLGDLSTIHAVQINYADQDADILGKPIHIYHQYLLEASNDGIKWLTVLDKSKNETDVPHDYHAFTSTFKARYIRLNNLHMANGKFAISGLRIFGKGATKIPDTVKQFIVLRGESEHRNAWLKWQHENNAIGYTIYYGPTPEQLYNSVMVYGKNEYYLNALTKGQTYYFQIEAFNEGGIGSRTPISRAD